MPENWQAHVFRCETHGETRAYVEKSGRVKCATCARERAKKYAEANKEAWLPKPWAAMEFQL